VKELPIRKACFYVWVSPGDCDPPHGLDMTARHDFDKVRLLIRAFSAGGFDMNEPALVGYALNSRIQLLTGTHRHMAAKEVPDQLLPVTLWLRSDVEECWGTELWEQLIADVPVRDLKERKVEEGFRRSPYERVEL
jgi:hypothetical protein